MQSSIYISIPTTNQTYTFSGILSVTHDLSLKILTDGESATGTDYINGARNQPNKVTLQVIESDIGHPAGWSNRMMQAMESIKRTRTLCDVHTPAFIYAGMLLSEFTATVDETSQSGWTGTLTFVQYLKPTGVTLNVYDNSSVAVHTGSTGEVQTISGQQLYDLLSRAGVR